MFATNVLLEPLQQFLRTTASICLFRMLWCFYPLKTKKGNQVIDKNVKVDTMIASGVDRFICQDNKNV